MSGPKSILICLLLIALTGAAAQVYLLFRAATEAAQAVQTAISRVLDGDPRAASEPDRAPLRTLVLAEVDKQAAGIGQDLSSQITAFRSDLRAESAAYRGVLDARLAAAQGTLDRVQAGLAPVLANAAALEANAAKVAASEDISGVLQDTRFLMARAARTAGHIEQASDKVEAAAPQIAQSVISIGKSADGIAADVKREADEITAPKKWWQKALGPIYTVGRLVAAFW